MDKEQSVVSVKFKHDKSIRLTAASLILFVFGRVMSLS